MYMPTHDKETHHLYGILDVNSAKEETNIFLTKKNQI